MKKTFVIGLVLLLLSAYPLYLMGVELWLSHYAYDRYEVSQNTGENYDYKSGDFNGHRAVVSVNLEPAANLPKDETTHFKSPVSTTIDGHDYSLPSPVDVKVYNGSTSVTGSVALLNLKDRQSLNERLAIIQRVDGEKYPDDLRYRVLFVQPDGAVTEEWFSYADRSEPLYRTVLAVFVHPEPLGFRSQVLSYWPTIFYPLLYPLLTGAVGLFLSILGGTLLLYRGMRRS